MNKEKAIKVLNGILHLNYRNFWDEECDDAIEMAIEALSQPIVAKCYEIDNDRVYCSPEMADKIYRALHEKTNVQNMHKGDWIPCSDGLPNEVDLYLVSLGEEVVETMGWNGEEFVKRGAKWSLDFITAWQPLPTPYKEIEVKE